MNTKKYLLIIVETILFASLLSIVIYCFLKEKSVAMGLFIGAVARATGFYTIIISSKNLVVAKKPAFLSVFQYVLRLVFYGIIISISLLKGLNIIALIIGFTILNLVILVNEKESKIGRLKSNNRKV